MGMGTATVMAQLAAETLGIPVERVRFEYGDTTLPQRADLRRIADRGQRRLGGLRRAPRS